MKENFIFTRSYLCPYKFCGAQYSLGLLSQIDTTHGSHIIDVIIPSVTKTEMNNDWYGLQNSKIKYQYSKCQKENEM
jgi:hypothetical protein